MNPKIDLNKAYIFMKIVEAGNISKAAKLLNEPKAKLSRSLALLEEDLGVQLVYRTTRQFRLTETGAIFYQKSKEHLRALTEAVDSLKDDDEQITGPLKITAPDDIGVHVLTKIINDFMAIYPKIEFELVYTNEVLDIVKLGIDIAFRVGSFKDSGLIQKEIATVEFVLASSQRYISTHAPIIELEHLSQHQTIGFSSTGDGAWKLASKNGKISLRLKHKITANNFITVCDLIKSGHGIGFLPRFICRHELASGEIVHILKHWGNEGQPLKMTLPKQKKISKKVRTFMNFVEKKCLEYF